MTTSDATRSADTSVVRGRLHAVRYCLGNRWALLALPAVVLITSAYISWGWLVAAGVAPIILTLAPCAIMCALGLCSMKMGGSGGPK